MHVLLGSQGPPAPMPELAPMPQIKQTVENLLGCGLHEIFLRSHTPIGGIDDGKEAQGQHQDEQHSWRDQQAVVLPKHCPQALQATHRVKAQRMRRWHYSLCISFENPAWEYMRTLTSIAHGNVSANTANVNGRASDRSLWRQGSCRDIHGCVLLCMDPHAH
eukprot:1156412-Pelagomonas_calceolata.AAC.1